MKKLFLFSCLFLSAVTLLAEELPPLPKGPLLLTATRPEQLNADYWIRSLPDPHRVLKAPAELFAFNEEINRMVHDTKNIFKLPLKTAGKPIRNQIELEYKTLKGRILFGVDDKRISASLFTEKIGPEMAWDAIPSEIAFQWGAAIKATSVRALPTRAVMLEEVGDYEFDQVQFTLIKLWTPVAVYHRSKSGSWLYIQAPYVRGWARASDIAIFKTRDELKRPARSDDFLAVTGESVPVYSDGALTIQEDRPSMGTRLPLANVTDAAYVVWIPRRGAGGEAVLTKCFVSRAADVTRGWMPFTQANIIRQAFKLLSARYGWGGTYGGRDCSGFTHDVFLSMGVDMPRDSKDQAFVGTQLGHFEPYRGTEQKVAALRSGTPALTLLKMPLHMMLYLGEENGRFYVIHSTWAERVSMTSDEKIRINQVVVSDLSLNGKSYLGSLFDRIVSVNVLD